MPLRITSQGELVLKWQRTMNARFSGYSREPDGTPLREDAYFGDSDANVQMEYQLRTGQSPTGRVGDGDLAALGLVESEKPVLFTVHGTFVDMWFGYPADCGRALSDLYYWQPVWYPAAAFPMGKSVVKGVAELVRLINELRPGRKFALAGYSQGAIVTALV